MRHIESLMIAIIGAGNVSIRDVKLPYFNFDYIVFKQGRENVPNSLMVFRTFSLYM